MAKSYSDADLPQRVPWATFIAQLNWKQGEHVGLIGPTGQGKTTLAMALLPLRKYVVAFATKPRDDTMRDLVKYGGYVQIEKWKNLEASTIPRRVLWPDVTRLDSDQKQAAIFRHALRQIYRSGMWCVFMDEMMFLSQNLHLEREIKTYLTQARSLKISLVVASQRPAWIPVEVYDQSTHLFFWRDNDERNLRRISGVSFISADLVRYVVSHLDEYEVLYVCTRTGAMLRTKAPAPTLSAHKRRARH